MPTYQYKCNECEHDFEVFQSIKDDPITSCEKCGGEVRKVYNATGIIFKGSGFYVNDYKKKGGESAGGDSAPAASSAGSAAAE